MNKTLDEYIDEVISFYALQGIPNTVDEALKGPKPKYFTYKSVKKYFDMNLLELLDLIHAKSGHVKTTAVRRMVPLDEQLKEVGLTLEKVVRDAGTTRIFYTCNNCKKSGKVCPSSTIKKWHTTGTKFCPDCRGSIKRSAEARHTHFSKMIEHAVYSDFVQVDSMLESNGQHGRLLLEFKCCGSRKEYNTSTFSQMVKDGAAFRCDLCAYPVSAMETYVEAQLAKHFDQIDAQVPYSTFAPCLSHWKVDFRINRKYLIEVTTGLTDKKEYSNNIDSKVSWAKENKVPLYIITSLFQIEDIVRTILKDIEQEIANPA